MTALIESHLLLSAAATVIGITLLMFGGDWFVDAACGIAARLRVPRMLVGATIVAMATTLPETMVSVLAHTTMRAPEIAVGNAVGSVICNIGLILATALLILPVSIMRASVLYQGFFLMTGGTLVWVLGAHGTLTRAGGLVLLTGLMLFLATSAMLALHNREAETHTPDVPTSMLATVALFILGLVLVIIGSKLLIAGAVGIAHRLHVPELVISLTVVSVGTSLPELATALVSAFKGRTDLSVGNIFGANILNIYQVLGVCGAIKPLTLSASVLRYDLPIMLLFCATLFLYALTGNRLRRLEGAGLLACYAAYLVLLASRTLAGV